MRFPALPVQQSISVDFTHDLFLCIRYDIIVHAQIFVFVYDIKKNQNQRRIELSACIFREF